MLHFLVSDNVITFVRSYIAPQAPRKTSDHLGTQIVSDPASDGSVALETSPRVVLSFFLLFRLFLCATFSFRDFLGYDSM